MSSEHSSSMDNQALIRVVDGWSATTRAITEAGRLQNEALAAMGPLLERLSARLLPRRTKKAWRKLSAGIALRPGDLTRLRRWRDRMGAALGPLEVERIA